MGFACAVGIDMGFNFSHHHENKELMAHHGSHHDEMGSDNHKTNDDNDNCCHDKVINLAQVDKAVPQYYDGINTIFFTAFASSFYNIAELYTSQVTSNIKYFARSYHPPIPDIRIAIQSFLI